MPKDIEKFLQTPDYEKRANQFVEAVNGIKREDQIIVALNLTATYLAPITPQVKDMAEHLGIILNSQLMQDIEYQEDITSATQNRVDVSVMGKKKKQVIKTQRKIEKLARKLKGIEVESIFVEPFNPDYPHEINSMYSFR